MAKRNKISFDRTIFINCPFDNEYKPLIKALIFAILYLDFYPLISETLSSSHIRVNEIINKIRRSKFGIHDLSRNRPLERGDLSRFNMPFELGIDTGCYSFIRGMNRKKKILILDKKKYTYHQTISDISGQDIRSHGDDPFQLIMYVRNWLNSQKPTLDYTPPSVIWIQYNQFLIQFPESMKKLGHSKKDLKAMEYSEYIKFCRRFIEEYKKR